MVRVFSVHPPFKVEDYCIGIEISSIMKFNAFPQLECPSQSVFTRTVLGCQLGLQLQIMVVFQ